MRIIGCIENETLARRFSSYLYLKGMENQVDPSEDGAWAVWVLSEDQIDASRELLERFLEDPDAPEYTSALQEVARKRIQKKKAAAGTRTRQIDVRTTWSRTMVPRSAPFTLSLIALSILVTLAADFGKRKKVIDYMSITKYEVTRVDRDMSEIRWMRNLPEILSGEIWRLFTPMFIHLSLIHILFNMLWLYDLGRRIEHFQGLWRLAILVLAISAASNLGQFIASGPAFGGMSGVVYGLLGYIWIRGKYDASSGLHLPNHVVVMMTCWFFACLVGIIPNVANTAHGVGLVMGMAWGFLASGRLGRFKNRPH